MAWFNGLWFEDCFICGNHHPKRDSAECERFAEADAQVQRWAEHYRVCMDVKAGSALVRLVLVGVQLKDTKAADCKWLRDHIGIGAGEDAEMQTLMDHIK